jgi:hypothetical protein
MNELSTVQPPIFCCWYLIGRLKDFQVQLCCSPRSYRHLNFLSSYSN